ncbi:MAG: CPBP family intramembrane metalloprotease [Bacillota bacterium]|nr:CPBP family intramembrane metalloprotease [Bacillota bacterium]
MQEGWREALERTPTWLLVAQEAFFLVLGWGGSWLRDPGSPVGSWRNGASWAAAGAGAGAGLLLGLLDLELSRRFPRYNDTVTPLLFRRFRAAGALAFTGFVALAEETLFRGWLQPALGAAAATLLFTLVHVQYLRRPPALLALLVYGGALAWLRAWSGGLLAPWLAHWGLDAVQALAVVYDRYPGLPPREGGRGGAGGGPGDAGPGGVAPPTPR